VALFAAGASALLVGCGGPPLPDQQVETKWATYHYWSEAPPCQEALQRLDDFVDSLATELSVTLPAGFKLQYYKMRRGELAALQGQLCDSDVAAACTRGAVTYSIDWVQLHELVHQVTDTVGDPPTAFAEGLAEVYGCGDARWVGSVIDRSVDLKAALPSSRWQPSLELYVAAGAFTRYLLDTYGVPKYLELYRTLGGGDDAQAIAQKFERVTGTSLDSALAGWRSGPEQRQGQICRFLIDECSSAVLLSVSQAGDRARQDESVSCLGGAAVVNVAAETSGVITFSADRAPRMVTVRPCDAVSDAPYAQWLNAPVGWVTAYPVGAPYDEPLAVPESEYLGKKLELWTSFASGRYLLRYGNVFPEDVGGGTASLEVSLGPSSLVTATPGQPIGDACLAAPTVAVGDDVWSIAVTGRVAPLSVSLFNLQLAAPRSMTEYMPSYFGSLAWSASQCAGGCQSIDQCESLSGAATQANGPVTVRLTAGGASKSQFARILFRPASP